MSAPAIESSAPNLHVYRAGTAQITVLGLLYRLSDEHRTPALDQLRYDVIRGRERAGLATTWEWQIEETKYPTYSHPDAAATASN